MRRLLAFLVGSALLFSCENDPKTTEKANSAVNEAQILTLELMVVEIVPLHRINGGIIIE